MSLFKKNYTRLSKFSFDSLLFYLASALVLEAIFNEFWFQQFANCFG